MRSEAGAAVAWHFGTMGALLILVAAAFALAWTAFGVKLLPIPLVYVLAVIWIADELPPLFWRGIQGRAAEAGRLRQGVAGLLADRHRGRAGAVVARRRALREAGRNARLRVRCRLCGCGVHRGGVRSLESQGVPGDVSLAGVAAQPCRRLA